MAQPARASECTAVIALSIKIDGYKPFYAGSCEAVANMILRKAEELNDPKIIATGSATKIGPDGSKKSIGFFDHKPETGSPQYVARKIKEFQHQ